MKDSAIRASSANAFRSARGGWAARSAGSAVARPGLTRPLRTSRASLRSPALPSLMNILASFTRLE
jgi:hypothetical protein